jgi:hypothetical protein
MPTRIFWLRERETRKRIKIFNEKCHNLCTSLDIIGVVKSRRMRCAEHVASTEQKRNAYKILVGNLNCAFVNTVKNFLVL